jgi:hypothetical protein
MTYSSILALGNAVYWKVRADLQLVAVEAWLGKSIC